MAIRSTRKSLAFMIIRPVEHCGNFGRYSLRHVFSVSKFVPKGPDRSVCEIRAIRIRAAGLAVMADDSSRCGERSCSSVWLRDSATDSAGVGRGAVRPVRDSRRSRWPLRARMIGCRPRLRESGVCSEQILLARPGVDTADGIYQRLCCPQALFARDRRI